MEDEGLILSNPHLAPAAVAAWSALGVDVVRIHARWWEIAPGARRAARAVGLQRRRSRRPALRLGQPRQRRRAWCARPGMRVMLTITGPGPLWASSEPQQAQPALDPDARRPTRAFARAVAARYARAGRSLPALERAQPAGLAAAAVGVRQPPAQLHAGLAARLPRAGARRRARDPRRRPGREVVIGELAPIGNAADLARTRRSSRCRSCASWAASTTRYRTLRTRALPAASSPSQADSFGYHPHPLLLRARTRRTRTPTRRSSPTSTRAVHACSTGCAPSAACASAGPST